MTSGQRIRRDQVLIVLHPLAVEQHAQAFGGADAEVMRALGADAEVGREILVVDGLGAIRTLDPEPFRNATGLVFLGRRDRLARLLEPRHSLSLYQ
jgi:hypothetical protein